MLLIFDNTGKDVVVEGRLVLSWKVRGDRLLGGDELQMDERMLLGA